MRVSSNPPKIAEKLIHRSKSSAEWSGGSNPTSHIRRTRVSIIYWGLGGENRGLKKEMSQCANIH